MSSSQSSQRPQASSGYRQDYIVRIRYHNNLPPPTAPPKLLDVPNAAFAQYTDPSFASRLARTGPLNIDVDSELGMPLDLVHVPRVFEGDDSVIRPMDPVPPVDPRDRALLRPAASLGKPMARTTTGGSNVSFLRRTEYISAEQSKSTFRSSVDARPKDMKRSVRPEDNDPVRILAAVMKGFDTANPETAEGGGLNVQDKAAANAERNWKELRHPNKPHLRAVETLPFLPHLEGTSDTGGYMIFKFSTSPTDPGEDGSRDDRVDCSLFQPVELPPDEDGNPQQEGREMFDFYVPATSEVAAGVKHKFSPEEDSDDEEFRYQYLRRYETKSHQPYSGANTSHPEELAMVLHPGDESRPRGAYFYPIITRYLIRPRRKTKYPMGMGMSQHDAEDEGELPTEALKLKVRGLDAAEKRRRLEYYAKAEGTALPGDDEELGDVDAEGEDEDAPGEEE